MIFRNCAAGRDVIVSPPDIRLCVRILEQRGLRCWQVVMV